MKASELVGLSAIAVGLIFIFSGIVFAVFNAMMSFALPSFLVGLGLTPSAGLFFAWIIWVCRSS